MPRPHVIRIPQRMFPFTPFTTRIPVTRIPTRARTTVIPSLLNRPFATELLKEYTPTKVALSTTICAFCRPINAMKSPIPTDTACFKFIGMALKIASRTFVKDRRINTIPSINTAARAVCQLYPICKTTV